MQFVAAIAYTLIGAPLALFADGAAGAAGGVIPPLNGDTAPTWALTAACSAFLLALSRAAWVLVAYVREASQALYGRVIEPFAKAQIALMDSLRSVQVSNAASLSSLAESTDAIREEIHNLRQQVQARGNQ